MNTSNQHIIHKVFVEVNTDSSTKADDMRSNMSSFVQEKILNHVEHYFNDVEAEFESQHIQLDSLEITIDHDDITNIHSIDLKTMVHKELDKTMAGVREEQLREAERNTKHEVDSIEKQEANANELPNHASNISVLGKKERAIHAVIQFLKTGKLPWWVSSNEEMINLMNEDFLIRVIQEKAPFFIQLLTKELHNKKFVKRIIHQFSNELLILIVATRFNKKSVQLQRLKKLLKADDVLPIVTQFSNKEKELFWTAVFTTPAQHKSNVRITAFYQAFEPLSSKNESSIESLIIFALGMQSTSKLIVANDSEVYQSLKTGIQEYLISEEFKLNKKQLKRKKKLDLETELKSSAKTESDLSKASEIESTEEEKFKTESERSLKSEEKRKSDAIKEDERKADSTQESLDQITSDIKAKEQEHSETDLSTESKDVKDTKEIDRNGSKDSSGISDEDKRHLKQTKESKEAEAKNRSSQPKSEKKVEIKKDITEEKENFIAENVGVILLHPFFKPFFKNVGLLNDENELTDPVLTAHCLHYAATGRESDFEFSLVFEKFLCGIPIEQPIEKDVPLTEEMKASIDAVLSAALGHWKDLKTESIALLRNEFLQRPGKIILDDNSPRIVIERKTIDIMLDKLPWGLGIVSIPWKEGLIYVEW